MGKSVKNVTFCCLSKGMLKDELKTYLNLTSDPHFICKRCFRLAQKKQNLCKPKKIKK